MSIRSPALFPTEAASIARPASAGTARGSGSGIALWLHRIRTRRALAALHPDQIREVGLDPQVLRDEAAKPFWCA